jgi:bis(5'-nucleosyl)-tetraphosphatase (symmetrical)
MATWAIGDLQGCYDPTQRLLERIQFDPARDRLWFCGDLVNRGGRSLDTLRLVHSLRANAVVTLGNHDLSLLAIAERDEAGQRKVNPDLQAILFAEDRDVLLDWLRTQPLLHVDRELGWAMVHAGLLPQWDLAAAEREAREIERVLAGDEARTLLLGIYGDKPAWAPQLRGLDRWRAAINAFTRMRYCSPRGRIDFESKGAPGTQPIGMYPWYEVPGHAERELKLACGHWSTLGLMIGHGVHALDTGAVWGGKLSALRLDSDGLELVQVAGLDVPAEVKPKRASPREADNARRNRGHHRGRDDEPRKRRRRKRKPRSGAGD